MEFPCISTDSESLNVVWTVNFSDGTVMVYWTILKFDLLVGSDFSTNGITSVV